MWSHVTYNSIIWLDRYQNDTHGLRKLIKKQLANQEYAKAKETCGMCREVWKQLVGIEFNDAEIQTIEEGLADNEAQ